MKRRINHFWNRLSRIGLRDDEGIIDSREVVFLNRIAFISSLVILAYMPLEVALNGFSKLHLTGILVGLTFLPLLFHRYRWFHFTRYYLFLAGAFFILTSGLLVGRVIQNQFAIIPLVLLGLIIFRNKWERLFSLLLLGGLYILQQQLYDVIPPMYTDMTVSLGAKFSNIFFLMALLLNFLLGYYFIGINTEYENIVVDQKESIAAKNKEITDSIQYARRIQSAILPPERNVKQLLPDSFIFYKPKDIVAGDFYWIENSGKRVFFAVADCTGHGVPGAMVSVVCNNALNRSVREFGMTKPAQILDQAREIVAREFGSSDEGVQDGMDISLCALDPATGMLEWAGANNPLLILRKEELIEIRPDKQPIGRFAGGVKFNNHEIPLEKYDRVYLFSDGFADQFGGERGKKLKYKGFKEILLSLQNEPMEEHARLLDERFEGWRRNFDQIDDVCVAGFRYV